MNKRLTMRRTLTHISLLLGFAAALFLARPGLGPQLGAQVSNLGTYFVPYSACSSQVSANSTGTNGFTVAGTSNTPVDQASTSATGATNTHIYNCDITPPARLGGGTPTAITNAVFLYGITTGGGNAQVQVATLASGTFNSTIVFGKIAFPVAGNSETASALAPVRADVGTLLITPTTANFNNTTTTAGQFFSLLFTPSAPIVIVDNTRFYLNVTIQTGNLTAWVTQTPGVIVHTR